MPDERDPSFDPTQALPESGPLMSSGVGLRFARLDNGSVLIIQDAASLADTRHFVIEDNIWASLIAHVSARGEAPGEWYKAMAFHDQPSVRVFVLDDAGKLTEV